MNEIKEKTINQNETNDVSKHLLVTDINNGSVNNNDDNDICDCDSNNCSCDGDCECDKLPDGDNSGNVEDTVQAEVKKEIKKPLEKEIVYNYLKDDARFYISHNFDYAKKQRKTLYSVNLLDDCFQFFNRAEIFNIKVKNTKRGIFWRNVCFNYKNIKSWILSMVYASDEDFKKLKQFLQKMKIHLEGRADNEFKEGKLIGVILNYFGIDKGIKMMENNLLEREAR